MIYDIALYFLAVNGLLRLFGVPSNIGLFTILSNHRFFSRK